MSTINPEDPLAALDWDVDEPDVINLADLSEYELANRWDDVRNELLAIKEMHAKPGERSERGKELHSQFTAIQIELKRREFSRKRHPSSED